MTITGAGAAQTTIDANHYGRVFQVIGNGTVTRLSGMTITNGAPPGGAGGGVLVGPGTTANLDSAILDDNDSGAGDGGGLAGWARSTSRTAPSAATMPMAAAGPSSATGRS